MTPLYLDSQEAVDRHNERVKVQREAARAAFTAAWDMARHSRCTEDVEGYLNTRFPLAQLRPQGFVGGSGTGWTYSDFEIKNHNGTTVFRTMAVDPSDRAAASAALTDGVETWRAALLKVATNHGCGFSDAANKYQSEVIAEAQAILDREGNK